MTERHRLTAASDIAAYIMAGNATFTLVSRRTGNRYTYKFRRRTYDSGRELLFASLLSGPDNENSYTYLGVVDNRGVKRTIGSRVTASAQSLIVINWFVSQLARGKVSDLLEVWHEGRCGRCGRKLTVPESIQRGLGPHCAGRQLGA